MCGIIAIIKRRSAGQAPIAGVILSRLDDAERRLRAAGAHGNPSNPHPGPLVEVAQELEAINGELLGTAGVGCMLATGADAVADAIASKAGAMYAVMEQIDARRDIDAVVSSPTEFEAPGARSCSCLSSWGSRVSAITLLHAGFRDRLAPDATRQLLSRYGNRFGALVDAVTETEPQFDEGLLDTIPLVELLTEPVDVIAGRWRRHGANEQDRPVPIASGRG